jgi:hypothetical protein
MGVFTHTDRNLVVDAVRFKEICFSSTGVCQTGVGREAYDTRDMALRRSFASDGIPEPSTLNSQPSTNVKLREYKAVYIQNDAETGLFSDEVVVNCAP